MAINKLFLKIKVFFYTDLGGQIITQGVQVDQSKISAIMEWPKPTTIRRLRGFLGLPCYYRKFVHNYRTIATPLTAMLCKNSFCCNIKVVTAFEEMKKAMTTTPILTLPNFEQPFVIECDASNIGIGAMLLQQNKPLAYINRLMAVRHQSLHSYEKELIGLVKAEKHSHSYLWNRKFIVWNDHYTLKFLVE